MKTIEKITGVFVCVFFFQAVLFAQKTATENVNRIAAGIVEKQQSSHTKCKRHSPITYLILRLQK